MQTTRTSTMRQQASRMCLYRMMYCIEYQYMNVKCTFLKPRVRATIERNRPGSIDMMILQFDISNWRGNITISMICSSANFKKRLQLLIGHMIFQLEFWACTATALLLSVLIFYLLILVHILNLWLWLNSITKINNEKNPQKRTTQTQNIHKCPLAKWLL